MCLYVIFQKIWAFFNSKQYFVSLSQKNLAKKVVFCHFLKKIIILSKIWYQKWILWLISIPEMYTFIYISVIIWKLQHSICFKKNLGSHPRYVKILLYLGLLAAILIFFLQPSWIFIGSSGINTSNWNTNLLITCQEQAISKNYSLKFEF